MTKQRMAGERTRQKLLAEGVSPALVEKPDLTIDEAYAALYQQRNQNAEDAIKAFWAALPEPPEGFLPVKDMLSNYQEIIGEEYYAANLESIFKKRAYNQFQAAAWASLVRNPDNPHDRFAVEVRVDGLLVGHIPRDISEWYSLALEAIEASGGQRICCPCVIDEGTDVWLTSGAESLENLSNQGSRWRITPPKTKPTPAPGNSRYEQHSAVVEPTGQHGLEYACEWVPVREVRNETEAKQCIVYFQNILNRRSADGWEFVSVDDFSSIVQPGCLGALFGVKQSEITFRVATFKRPIKK